MLLFRSLTLGLLGACFLLIATRPTVEIRRSCPMQTPTLALAQRPIIALESPRPLSLPPAVVDVAPGVSASQLASLVRLDEGERVATIDDRAVSGTLDAGVALAALDLTSRRYIDLGVEGPRGTRRVLVLLH